MPKLIATLKTVLVLLGLWLILLAVGLIAGVVPLGLGGWRGSEGTGAGDALADGGAGDSGAGDAGAGGSGARDEAVDHGRGDSGADDADIARGTPASGSAPPLDGTTEALDSADQPDRAQDAPGGSGAGRTYGVRFSVCEASREPSLSVVDLFGDRHPEIIVGCADGWHVLGLGAAGLQRIAVFLAPPTPDGQRAVTGPAAVGDVDGDGASDLVLPLAWFDADSGASRGGGLFWVPRDGFGGVREPVALAPITAVALGLGAIDGSDGQEIAAMNRANPLAQLDSEAWVFTGGGSPTRLAALVAGEDGRAVAVSDADRDGHADVIALADGRLDIHFGDGQGAFERTHRLDLEGARELGVGDIDGDGGADLVVLGGGLRWIRSGALAGMEPRGVDGVPANLRGLQVLDADADGSVDLLGWDHPRLIWLRQRDAIHFDPTEAFTLVGGPFGPRRHAVADLDADGRPDDLVLLGGGAGERAPLEVIVLQDALDGAELTPGPLAATVPDAPLVLRATLR